MKFILIVSFSLLFLCFIGSTLEENIMKCEGTIYSHVAPNPPLANQAYTTWSYVDLTDKCKNPDIHTQFEIYHNLLYAHIQALQPGFLQINPPLISPSLGNIQTVFKWECKNCGAHGEKITYWDLR